MRSVFEALLRQLEKSKPATLVLVLEASGSAPRGAGAMMLVPESGATTGTVGGGAIEHRATQLGLEAVQTGKSGMHEFRLNHNDAQQLGMICGGDVWLLLYVIKPQAANIQLVKEVLACFDRDDASWLLFRVSGQKHNCQPEIRLLTRQAPGNLLCGNQPVLRRRENLVECGVPLVQPGRVLIFGGGHLAQQLGCLLPRLNFNYIVYDDRPEFAQQELFPGARQVICGKFEEFDQEIQVQPEDYAVVVTRGHAADYIVLEKLLRMPTVYTGVVGSRAKTVSVNQRLRQAGIPQPAIDQVHTPIGLPILAHTPAEIAISIAAELIEVRAKQQNKEL